MADRKLNSDYDDALLNLAVSDMLEDYGRELAEKFERELNKAYRNGRLRSFRTKAVKFSKYAVTVCAAFIVVFAVSVVSVDAFRLRFLEWLFNIHESHISLDISNDNNAYSNMVHADYLPNEYELTSYNNSDGEIELAYIKNAYYIKVRIYLDNYTFNSDVEDTSIEEVYINGSKGQYQKKELISTLLWYDNENSYWISTNDPGISKDEIVKIAQSIN